MIRTKQITVVCASVALLCILCVQAFAARSASPNYATNSHEDMSLYYYGYVQCRPSYNDDGAHAQAGYIRYWRYDLLGNVVTKSHTYTDSIIPNPHKTQFRYGFIWQPHRDKSIPWPLPYSIGNVTK